MAKKRLTVLADPVADSDVVEYFEGKGVTETGLKLIRAAMVLDEADLLDHITMLSDKGMIKSIGALESVKKALEISALFVPDKKPEPPKPVKNRTGFGSAKN